MIPNILRNFLTEVDNERIFDLFIARSIVNKYLIIGKKYNCMPVITEI